MTRNLLSAHNVLSRVVNLKKELARESELDSSALLVSQIYKSGSIDRKGSKRFDEF